MKPKVLIPIAPGTNCHHELAFAFELCGASAITKPLKVLAKTGGLSECDILALSGGFSMGDHFGSGRVVAMDLSRRMQDDLAAVVEKKIPVIGICNGFQILVNLGLLPGGGPIGDPTAALDFNLQYRFEHWHSVKMCLREPKGVASVWTKGLDGREIHLPVGHGEGRIVADDPLNVVATYGTAAHATDSYPASPNGSMVAGICSDNGLVMGIMPHPERRVERIHGGTDGRLIIEAGINSVLG